MRERNLTRLRGIRRAKTDPLRVKVNICKACNDLPWRRDAAGCERCGLPRADESPHVPEPRNSSAVAGFESW